MLDNIQLQLVIRVQSKYALKSERELDLFCVNKTIKPEQYLSSVEQVHVRYVTAHNQRAWNDNNLHIQKHCTQLVYTK